MMKNIMKYVGMAVTMASALVACSPDSYDGGNEAAIPSIQDLKCNVVVDQTTNYVTFSIDNPGCYPIWDIAITPAVHSTENGIKKFIPTKGTYAYTVQLANKNGISQGSFSGEFTVDETRYDFSAYEAALTTDEDGNLKQWRIYASKAKHMGCSALYGDGVEWWAASPHEKDGEAIYDDFITFAADGTYTYNPGPDGLIFCNSAYKLFTSIDTGDYHWPVEEKTTTYGFTIVNDEPAIALAPQSYFPYLSSNAFYQSPVFRIVNPDDFKKNGKVLELIGDDPANNISWKYIFINGDDEPVEEPEDLSQIEWADATSDANIFRAWNEALPTYTSTWSNWSWADDATGHPAVSFSDGVITTVWPKEVANWEYWHGFIQPKSDVTIEKDHFYDFSVTLEATPGVDGVLVKIEADPESGTPLFEIKDIQLEAGVPNTIQLGKLFAEVDYTNAQMLISLKGAQAGTTVKISNIILQEHTEKAIDDGYFY